MEKVILDLSSNGIAGLLVGLCVLISLNLFTKVGAFLWNMKQSKDKLTEEGVARLTRAVGVNTLTTEKNTQQIAELQKALTEIPKIKLDLRRSFAAMKILAGERWQEIRKDIMEVDN